MTSDFPSPRLSTSVHEGTSALNYSGKIPLVLGRKPNERISGTQITDSTSQFNKLAGIWCEFQPHPACTLVRKSAVQSLSVFDVYTNMKVSCLSKCCRSLFRREAAHGAVASLREGIAAVLRGSGCFSGSFYSLCVTVCLLLPRVSEYDGSSHYSPIH